MVGVPALRPETFSRFFPKIHRAQTRNTEAIKHKLACGRRLEARFFTASPLVMRLQRARGEGGLDRKMSQIARARMLVADEHGFLPLNADGARLIFQVFADAYEKQSVVITTNLEFSRWGSVFGDDQMAVTVIDRVVHHGRLVQFCGESHRVRHTLMQDG